MNSEVRDPTYKDKSTQQDCEELKGVLLPIIKGMRVINSILSVILPILERLCDD